MTHLRNLMSKLNFVWYRFYQLVEVWVYSDNSNGLTEPNNRCPFCTVDVDS